VPPVPVLNSSDEKPTTKKKRYTLLPGERNLTLVSNESTKAETEWKVDDKVEAPWTDGELYPGRIAEKHDDGTYTVQFDDGDVRTMQSDGFVRIDKFDTTTPFKGIEGTIITCSEKCSQSYPLSSLFDYKHGTKGSKSNEWRIKVVKQQNNADNKNGSKKNVKLTIRFSKNYYISRIHIYHTMPDQANTMTNYSLCVIPTESASSKLAQKPVEIVKLVDTTKELPAGMKEFIIERHLRAVIVTLPYPPSKKWIGLGAIDIFHKHAEEKRNVKQTNFREDVGNLLKNPVFADCRIIAGRGEHRRAIAAHKNILACRSDFFRKMLQSSSLSSCQSPASPMKIAKVKKEQDEGRGRKRIRLSKTESGNPIDGKRPPSSPGNNDMKVETGPLLTPSSSIDSSTGLPPTESKAAAAPRYGSTLFDKRAKEQKSAENFDTAMHVLPVAEKMQEIHMPELTYSILMSVLTFIYEDRLIIKDVDEAVELWCTSERYQFLRLQEQVEKYLEHNLTVEKAIEICRTLRELHLLGSLKELLISYLATEIDTAMVQRDFVSIPKDIMHNIFCQTQNQKQIETAFSHG